MKPNIDYDDMFNSGGMLFEQPLASLYLDYVDPISILEQELEEKRDKLLNTLESDKDIFLSWLAGRNIKSTLKMETLELLISCWLASKQHHSYMNQLIRSNHDAITIQ